ncbi:hypothetical protein GCM10009682_08740 [Luedemannella flava]|uniref:Secreted protein n=1 Tax=Luedemannella flava TaxID=349316 RepID=A0ABN2LJP4_9ACTN
MRATFMTTPVTPALAVAARSSTSTRTCLGAAVLVVSRAEDELDAPVAPTFRFSPPAFAAVVAAAAASVADDEPAAAARLTVVAPADGHSAGGFDAAGNVSVELGRTGGADHDTLDTGTAGTVCGVGGAANVAAAPGHANAGWSDRVPTSTPASAMATARLAVRRSRSGRDVCG